jgi:phage replication O-like protein O
MSYKGPNYTQIPNLLLDDHMPLMKEAELKIVMAIARQTLGWHKQRDKLSISQLMEKTGLSKQGVIDGVNDGLKRGVIDRQAVGQGFTYGLVVSDVDQSTELTSQDSGQVSDKPVKNSDKQEPPTSQQSRHTKERSLKESNTKESMLDAAPLTDQQEWFKVVCAIVAWDSKVLGAKEKAQVAQTITILKGAGYTLEEAKSFLEKVWMKDWRYKKDGQMPTLTQLRTEIGKLRNAAPIMAKETSAYASFG